jgi:hypothetical protein
MRPLNALTLLITFILSPTAAQQATIAPPPNPIVTPINGEFIAGNASGSFIFNPATGVTRPLPSDVGRVRFWDPQGLYIASTASIDGSGIPNGRLQVSSIEQQTTQTLLEPNYTRDSNIGAVWYPVGWSQSSDRVLYYFRIRDGNAYPGATVGGSSNGFDLFDVASGQMTRVVDIPPMTLVKDVFPSPIARDGMILDFIKDPYWNPVYTEWIFVQLYSYGKNDSGEDIGGRDAGIYNWVTRQYISLTTLFPQTVISGTGWNADGSLMALNTMTGISVIQFSLDASGAPRLRLIADGIDSNEQAVRNWLGVDNLLISGISAPYRTTFIAQIIGDEWYSQEFVAATPALTISPSPGSWRLTADEAEQKALRCLFVDRAIVPRLSVGGRGQVAFTDGTPSRLRYAPGTLGSVAVSLPEGTAFTVVGGPECTQGYRWWQVQLADGTTGWVAEGSPDEYWLEPQG